jgi:hypothetical protein
MEERGLKKEPTDEMKIYLRIGKAVQRGGCIRPGDSTIHGQSSGLHLLSPTRVGREEVHNRDGSR